MFIIIKNEIINFYRNFLFLSLILIWVLILVFLSLNEKKFENI